jgi:DNA-binding NarL/FixJ family response regulator
MKKTTLIIVDDHKFFRDGLKLNLAAYSDVLEIIGEAASGDELTALLNSGLIPDVIFLDCQMPGKNGIEVTKELKRSPEYQHVKIIMLSAHKDYKMNASGYGVVLDAIDAGMDGFILKDAGIEEIVNAVNEVKNGNGFIFGETCDIKSIMKLMVKERKSMLYFLKKKGNFNLTDREIEVIKHLSYGLSAKQIASKLHISKEVVNTHKENIKFKLQDKHNIVLKNVVEMVVWAIRNKVIEL